LKNLRFLIWLCMIFIAASCTKALLGDHTKDGELINHESVKDLLHQLADAGIKVFVVPGNHDINNPEALSFKGETPSPVSSVIPEDFASIYGSFGYNDALYRDENSLSYISQPFSNVWILVIDACKYKENVGSSDVSGAIKPATLDWIQVKLIFTGHYQANYVTEYTSDGKKLNDVETGSLVTPLIPLRIMTLDDNYINFETRHVTSIDATLPGGMDFLTYSNLFTPKTEEFRWNDVNTLKIRNKPLAI
jgi:hypothetical protein